MINPSFCQVVRAHRLCKHRGQLVRATAPPPPPPPPPTPPTSKFKAPFVDRLHAGYVPIRVTRGGSLACLVFSSHPSTLSSDQLCLASTALLGLLVRARGGWTGVGPWSVLAGGKWLTAIPLFQCSALSMRVWCCYFNHPPMRHQPGSQSTSKPEETKDEEGGGGIHAGFRSIRSTTPQTGTKLPLLAKSPTLALVLPRTVRVRVRSVSDSRCVVAR